ncbi:uncharacterized protein PV09_03614 [Verruconis gallopava]|uniref:Uncharacterized protein n=1 Tax=Verruconis gallopava TaxID=253628 RepID=A0A0D2B376_9PEZI|nr:uncharacterized protein PV09_03614 [Verruconis gallopava]KIW05759.1 hypothetical protein PV09_03614 [Verruconis gallopava]
MSNIRYFSIHRAPTPFSRLRIPWLSVALLGLSLSCIVAAALTIRLLHNRSTSHWYSSPAVVLAVIASVFNVATGTLVSIGVATLWWRAASRGTTFRSLHLIWDRGLGLGFFSALASDGNTRRTTIAAAIVAIARFAAGPLLQQAVGQAFVQIVQPLPMKVFFSENFVPDRDPVGVVRIGDVLRPVINYNAAAYLRLFEQNDLEVFFNGVGAESGFLEDCPETSTDTCGGYACPRNSTCIVKAKGLSISANCSSTTETFKLDDPQSQGKVVFGLDMALLTSPIDIDDTYLRLSTAYNNYTSRDCVGHMVYEDCDIRGAWAQYEMEMTWSNISLVQVSNTGALDYPLDSLRIENKTEGEVYPAGPLMTLIAVFSEYYSGQATLLEPKVVNGTMQAMRFWDISKAEDSSICANTYRRPAPTVITKMRQYLFISLQVGGQQAQISQDVVAEEHRPVIVHRLERDFFIAALCTMAAGILAIVGLHWKFWELDRAVSLSPVETAKALDAPLLRGSSLSCEADDILDEVGSTKVRYDGTSFSRCQSDSDVFLDNW